jgi:hypothetical protein
MPVSMCLSLALSGCTGSQGGTGGLVPIRQGGQSGSATTSHGGAGGSTPTCTDSVLLPHASCNAGDQQVAAGPGLDSSGLCPPERECYTLQGVCGSVVCLLPDGVHCSDLVSCNPGDMQIPKWDPGCVGYPSPCYTNYLCTQSITCKNSASPYGGVCSGTWSDAGVLEPPDASADGSDAGRIPCCGDGIVDDQYGEMCDFGPLNGKCLDPQGNPTSGGCSFLYCSPNCMMPI